MITMKTIVAAGLLIFGWGALATSAEAKIKLNAIGGSEHIQASAAPCVGQEFFTIDGAIACVAGTVTVIEDGPLGASGFYYNDAAGNQIDAKGSYYTATANGRDAYVQYSSGHGSFNVRATAVIKGTKSPLIYNQYPGQPYPLLYTAVLYTSGVPEREKCTLNAKWASWGLPKRVAGSEPPSGAKFRIAYQSDVALPAVVTDGGTTAPEYLFKVNMSEGSECTFRRETRVHIPNDDPQKVGVMVYTVSLWTQNGDSTGDFQNAPEVDEIVVTAKRKISKPIVPYGTKFDADARAKMETNIVNALLQLYGTNCGSNCKTTDGQQIPATVVAKQEDPAVKFVHPAPQQLARDNPGCTQTYDPRCAWNPSPTQPATAQTPPDQLVRMSNDGQTIVHNSTSVYNNTVYPDVMREAGTAPTTGTPGAPGPTPGTTDNPADPDGEDGEGKGLVECAQTEGCGAVTNGTVRAYIQSVGADPDRDQSSGGVAGGILDRAVQAGSCSTDKSNNPYCQMIAGFAMMKAGEGGTGDYVWWEGEIGVGPARKFQQASIPGSLIAAIDNILSVLFLVICWNIALRGRV